MRWDILIHGATTVSSSGQKRVDVGLHKGKIAAIGNNLPKQSALKVISAEGKHLLPGVIDSQVHFREPGMVHKEGFATGGRAAALGGVTTILDMPNTKPSTTNIERLEEKFELAANKCPVNFGLFVGATGDNLEDIKKCLSKPYCHGIKIFLGSSTGDLLLYDQNKLISILEQCEAPIAVHSENEPMLQERLHVRDSATSAHAHPKWRNPETALSSTKMIISLCQKAKRKVHVLHLSTAEEMAFLKGKKDYCTVEVTPQHLTLFAPDCYDRLGTYAQMNPPIREEFHRKALWEGLHNDVVDVIGSDHAPHTREEKDRGYPLSPAGMPGVQTLLPLMLDWASKGEITLEKLVKLVCENPAKLYGLKNKGFIKEGYDGDLTLVDTQLRHTLSNQEQVSKVGWTPFDKIQVTGMPIMAIVQGKIVMENFNLVETSAGRPIQC